MRRPAFAWLALLSCSACAHAPSKPTSAPPPPPPAVPDELRVDRDPATFLGDDRSLDSKPLTLPGRIRGAGDIRWRLPIAEIPRLGPSREPVASDGASFELGTGDAGAYELVVHRQLLAEASVNSFRAFTNWTATSPSKDADVLPGDIDDNEPRFNQRGQGGFTCGEKGKQPAPANLRGLLTTEWTDESVTYIEYPASFDTRTCKAAATSIREGSARALWPGVVYSFLSDDGGSTYLHVLAPHASWVAAAPEPVAEQRAPDVGTFTHARVKLGDTTASVVLELSSGAISMFIHARRNEASRAPELAPPVSSCPYCPMVRVIIDANTTEVRTSLDRLGPSALVDQLVESAPPG